MRPMDMLQRPLRVISDSSMTMRFSLPSSFLQSHPVQSSAALVKSKMVENVIDDISESWEERDWDTEVMPTLTPASKFQELDEWEQKSMPDLPDDFPRLIVNLTRIQRQHFPVSKEEKKIDMMEVFRTIETALHQHYTQLVEVLFEQKTCFHCTYGNSHAMINNLHAAYPEDSFAMVDYPTMIDNVPLHEFLYHLSCPSKWKSVEYLKDCLRQCSRDIRWKRSVITELEVLAELESQQSNQKMKRLSDDIDELSRLRDSFRAKLEKIAKVDCKRSGQYLMLRKLEDIENRLGQLLNKYFTEPVLENRECYGAFGHSGNENGIQVGMNVLDMVIAMVFSRLPRDLSQQTTTQEHYQMLFDHHIHILRLWKKDFGRLPPQSRAAPVINGSESDTRDVFNSKDEHCVSKISDQTDIEKQAEAFSVYCQIDDSKSDNRESEHFVTNDAGYNVEDKTCQDNDMDGYNADFDSDHSEEEQTITMQVTSQRKKSHRKHTKRSIRRTSQLEQLQSERLDGNTDRDCAPFRPFACTGAVNLLRLAKEKELF